MGSEWSHDLQKMNYLQSNGKESLSGLPTCSPPSQLPQRSTRKTTHCHARDLSYSIAINLRLSVLLPGHELCPGSLGRGMSCYPLMAYPDFVNERAFIISTGTCPLALLPFCLLQNQQVVRE